MTEGTTYTEGQVDSARLGGVNRRTLVALLPVVALLGTVAALAFRSGGYIFSDAIPVALAAAGLTVVGVWLARSPTRPLRAYLVALIAFAAFVVWTGLSILWSVGPDLSWVAFDFAALYLLVMAVCGTLPGGKLQLRLAAYGFALVVLVIATYALLGKVVPDVVTHAHVYARLRAPIGYWNVLAAMIAMAVPIGLEAASRRDLPPWVRGLVSSGLTLAFFTFFFTFSRGAYVAFAAALLVYFAFSRTRLSGLVSLVVPLVVTAGALYRVRDLDTLFAETADDALRTAQGHTLAYWVMAALALAFAAQALVAFVQRHRPLSARAVRFTGIAVLVALAAAPIVFSVYYFPRHGGLVDWVTIHYESALSASTGNDVSRLTTLGSSGRIPWYQEALKSAEVHPVEGTGAGTFGFTHYLYRESAAAVKHSHSQWLNVLSELGVVGLVLFTVAIGSLVVAAFTRLPKRRGDPERSLLAACQAAIVFFVIHMSLDWDWDMATITVSFLLLAGAAAAYAAAQRRAAAAAASSVSVAATGRRLPLAVRLLATGLIVFGAVSWTLPYLSERATSAAIDDLSRGQSAEAAAAARTASSLDPLAVDPLILLAQAQAAQGEPDAARETLTEAVRLQPRNYVTYYQMGMLELNSFQSEKSAEAWLRRALALNPMDPLTRRDLSMP